MGLKNSHLLSLQIFKKDGKKIKPSKAPSSFNTIDTSPREIAVPGLNLRNQFWGALNDGDGNIDAVCHCTRPLSPTFFRH